jgi:hypothetical protein
MAGRSTKGRSWPGRAEAALKFGAGKLTSAGVPRPSFRARREGLLMAEKHLSPIDLLRLEAHCCCPFAADDNRTRVLFRIRLACRNLRRNCPQAQSIDRGFVRPSRPFSIPSSHQRRRACSPMRTGPSFMGRQPCGQIATTRPPQVLPSGLSSDAFSRARPVHPGRPKCRCPSGAAATAFADIDHADDSTSALSG